MRLEAADRILELHGELPCLFRNPEDGRCGTVVIASGDFRPQSLLPAFCFYAAALLSDSHQSCGFSFSIFECSLFSADR